MCYIKCLHLLLFLTLWCIFSSLCKTWTMDSRSQGSEHYFFLLHWWLQWVYINPCSCQTKGTAQKSWNSVNGGQPDTIQHQGLVLCSVPAGMWNPCSIGMLELLDDSSQLWSAITFQGPNQFTLLFHRFFNPRFRYPTHCCFRGGAGVGRGYAQTSFGFLERSRCVDIHLAR